MTLDDFVTKHGGESVEFINGQVVPAGRGMGRTTETVTPDRSQVVFIRVAVGELWLDGFRKMVSHLRNGIGSVVVLSDATRTAVVYHPDAPASVLQAADTLTLPGFAVAVARLFD